MHDPRFIRRTRMNYPGGSYETRTYDGNSNMTQYRTRAGVTVSCTFDSRNRETAASWSDGTPGVTTAYDAVGRVTSLQNTHASLGFTYDYAGRLLSESQAPAGAAPSR